LRFLSLSSKFFLHLLSDEIFFEKCILMPFIFFPCAGAAQPQIAILWHSWMALKVAIRIFAYYHAAKSCDASNILARSCAIPDIVHLVWRRLSPNCPVRVDVLLYLRRFLVGLHCHLANFPVRFLRQVTSRPTDTTTSMNLEALVHLIFCLIFWRKDHKFCC
jgi:hypothetical protein